MVLTRALRPGSDRVLGPQQCETVPAAKRSMTTKCARSGIEDVRMPAPTGEACVQHQASVKEQQMSYRDFTYEQIAATFEYDPETGEFWRKLPYGTLRRLRVVREDRDWRCRANGIIFRGYSIMSTHLMWMLMKRRWLREGYVIDYRNGEVCDCRWSNLREANHFQSSANSESVGWGRWVSDDEAAAAD
jgi:hypothetical protein